MPKRKAQEIKSSTEILIDQLKELAAQVEAIRLCNARLEGAAQLLARPLLLSTLTKYFRDSRQLRAYELSDGHRSTRDIGRLLHVDQKTVSTWWRTWQSDHKIVEKVGRRGQFRAIFTIFDLFLMNYTYPGTARDTESKSGR